MITPDDVKDRLAGFGYAVRAEDSFALAFSLEKTMRYVLTSINHRTLPEEIRHLVIDLTAADFLLGLAAFNGGTIPGLDASATVKQIQEGDTSVTFAVADGENPDRLLEAYLRGIKDAAIHQMNRFRRLKW